MWQYIYPYRYPQLQKDKMEHQCAAMLRNSIIQSSSQHQCCWSKFLV